MVKKKKKVTKKVTKKKTVTKKKPPTDKDRLRQLEMVGNNTLRAGALSLHWARDVSKIIYTATFYDDGTFSEHQNVSYGLPKKRPKSMGGK